MITTKNDADLFDKKASVMDAIKEGSLTYEKLRLISDNRARYSFTASEIILLERSLQEAMHVPHQVCMQCGMVGDNCTCGRSWY